VYVEMVLKEMIKESVMRLVVDMNKSVKKIKNVWIESVKINVIKKSVEWMMYEEMKIIIVIDDIVKKVKVEKKL
jgi:hypothetical protein